MATVIVGGGIIGLATAYYLSLERPPRQESNPEIHVVDSSHSLMLSASGLAGGFIAEDWFNPASASLGALSFKLHRDLAKANDGYRRWGYAGARTYALSIDENAIKTSGAKSGNGDWLASGTSRAEVAPGGGSDAGVIGSRPEVLNPDGSPLCFTPQPSGHVSVTAEPDTTAQIEPRLLCEFLVSECQSRGVQVHLSATPVSIITNPTTHELTGLVYSNPRVSEPITLSCTNLVLAAGAWTPSVFKTLFPSSKLLIPVYPLAGTSLLARSPRYTVPFPHIRPSSSSSSSSSPQEEGMCYAIYSGPMPATFAGHRFTYAPEAFARLGQDSRPEVWIGGLNHPELRLPERAEDVEAMKKGREGDVEELRRCLVQLCGRKRPLQGEKLNRHEAKELNEDDLEILRDGLCFRPVSETNVPILQKVSDGELGGVTTEDNGGVFLATGHGPWGVSLSLGSGKVVSELVLGRPTSADISQLRMR